MGSEESPPAGDYIRALVQEARRLQHEARCALDAGLYTRASALIADAELLAEDVHDLVSDAERLELSGLTVLDAYDVRAAERPIAMPDTLRARLAAPSRRLRIAIGASLVLGFALAEY